MTSTSLQIPDDLNARLNALAQRTGRPTAFYILEALKEHLDDLEDIYEADVIMERVRTGKEALYTSGQVEKMLGLGN